MKKFHRNLFYKYVYIYFVHGPFVLFLENSFFYLLKRNYDFFLKTKKKQKRTKELQHILNERATCCLEGLVAPGVGQRCWSKTPQKTVSPLFLRPVETGRGKKIAIKNVVQGRCL